MPQGTLIPLPSPWPRLHSPTAPQRYHPFPNLQGTALQRRLHEPKGENDWYSYNDDTVSFQYLWKFIHSFDEPISSGRLPRKDTWSCKQHPSTCFLLFWKLAERINGLSSFLGKRNYFELLLASSRILITFTVSGAVTDYTDSRNTADSAAVHSVFHTFRYKLTFGAPLLFLYSKQQQKGESFLSWLRMKVTSSKDRRTLGP